MVAKIEDVLRQVLQMPESDRAFLVERLIASLAPEEAADPDAEAAWQNEIARRIADLESGRVTAVQWDAARERIRKSLHALRGTTS